MAPDDGRDDAGDFPAARIGGREGDVSILARRAGYRQLFGGRIVAAGFFAVWTVAGVMIGTIDLGVHLVVEHQLPRATGEGFGRGGIRVGGRVPTVGHVGPLPAGMPLAEWFRDPAVAR